MYADEAMLAITAFLKSQEWLIVLSDKIPFDPPLESVTYIIGEKLLDKTTGTYVRSLPQSIPLKYSRNSSQILCVN